MMDIRYLHGIAAAFVALEAAQRVDPVTLARVSHSISAVRRGADVMNAMQVFRDAAVCSAATDPEAVEMFLAVAELLQETRG